MYEFVKQSSEAGVDIFRVFDSLNFVDNMLLGKFLICHYFLLLPFKFHYGQANMYLYPETATRPTEAFSILFDLFGKQFSFLRGK